MKADEFSALGDRVLVKPDEVAEKKVSGIIVPANAQEKPLTATVVSVGQGVSEPSIAEGQTILYSKYGGMEVTFDEGPYLLLREQDVLGVVGGRL